MSSGSPALDAFWAEKGARFTELLHVGGPNPHGYGFIHGGGLYGRTGLEQDEFFESITMLAYVDGMIAVLGKSAGDWLTIQINEMVKKHKEAQEAATPPPPSTDVPSTPSPEGAS